MLARLIEFVANAKFVAGEWGLAVVNVAAFIAVIDPYKFVETYLKLEYIGGVVSSAIAKHNLIFVVKISIRVHVEG